MKINNQNIGTLNLSVDEASQITRNRNISLYEY